MKILLSLLILINFYNVYSLKFFHDGRFQSGFLSPRAKRDDGKNYTRWFTQNLDHFDMQNLNTWQQRYFVNDEFQNKTERNVAFLSIGGEGVATDAWMSEGAWVDYAKANDAILFQIEHRFYGKSRPTEDLSVENLKYLTSQQALADIAVFVKAMNAKYNLSPNVKWIAFGFSYAGSLAAWLKLKYPHIIHAAVSSSGPLMAISNYQDYYGLASDDLFITNEDCYKVVKKGFADAEDLLQDADGRDTLTSLFQLCTPLNNATDNDISRLFNYLATVFGGVAQSPRESDRSLVCGIMTNTSRGEEIDRLAYFYSLSIAPGGCLDYNYSNTVDLRRNTTWSESEYKADRQWYFQGCNEFGYLQTSDKEPHVFGHRFPLSYWIKLCVDVYGDKFNGSYVDAAVERTNTFYGGVDIEVTNVVFVHGSLDPWHALGVTKTRSPSAPVIFINGTSHCADADTPSDDDLPALTEARKQIGQLIRTWLNQ